MEQDIAIPKILPPPIGGWNARDPLHAMADSDAVELVNFFPDWDGIKIRGGTTLFCDQELCGLFALPKTTSTGASYLIGISETHIYRIQVSNAAVSDVTGAVTPDIADFQGTIFKGRLFCVSGGTVAPFDVGTTGNAAATTWSGSGLSIANLFAVTSHKGRLYFAESGTSNVWYGGLEAITGTLTKFDCSSALSRGGSIAGIGTTSRQGGSNSSLFAIVSTEGEVLLYAGDYPGSPTWEIIGSFCIAKPVNNHALFYKASGLHIVTRKGIVSIAALLNGDFSADGEVVAITDKVKSAFNDAVDSTSSWTAWGAADLPSQKTLIVYGPGYLTSSEFQFVQNTATGAWCKYKGFGGLNASFVEVDNRVFALLNSSTLNVFKLYELAKPGTSGNLDEAQPTATHTYTAPGTPIQCTCRQAFTYCDNPTVNKHLTQAKLFFSLTQESGHSQTTREVKVGVDSDFDTGGATNQMTLQSIATDGTVNYKAVSGIRGQGTAFSLLLNCRFGGGYLFRWFLSMLRYESGGFDS